MYARFDAALEQLTRAVFDDHFSPTVALQAVVMTLRALRDDLNESESAEAAPANSEQAPSE